MSPTTSNNLINVIAEIDAANAKDPRHDTVDGNVRPRELLYSERMTDCTSEIYPNASEELQIAARAQHICRWQIPRTDYARDRQGYLAWRKACREHHVKLTSDIMKKHGYRENQVEQVANIIKKQHLKREPDSQALENVVVVVFAKHYLEEFVARNEHDEEKLVNILRKTFRKLDAAGYSEIAKLDVSERLRPLIKLAMD